MINYEEDNPKLRKSDRILTLEPIDPTKVKDVTGMIDPRLFKGENRLHVVMDSKTCLWSFKYDMGGVPEAIRNKQFTSFKKAYDHAERYFNKRGVKITKVED